MQVRIDVDNRTILRIIAVVVAFLILMNVISALIPALTLIMLSAFLAVALNPPVSYLTHKIAKGKRTLATAIAYLLVVAVIGLFLYILIPPLVSQTGKLIDETPELIEQLKNSDNALAQFVVRYDLDEEITHIGETIKASIGDSNGPVFSSIEKIGTAIISLLTVLVLTFLMLIEGPEWVKRFWETVPEKTRAHKKGLATKMYNVVTGYVNGQLLIALMAGIASLIMMLILGMPYALPLAGVVAMFGLVPLVGATIGSATVIIIALFQSATTAIIMLVFFFIYQQIENNVFQPMIQSRRLDVSPLLVLISVIVGFSIGGFVGGVVAIPVAACAKIYLMDIYEHRKTKSKARKSPRLVLKKPKSSAR